ncbi:MAG: thioredoxin domain-containing protein [Rhodoferax sp.]|nr:thioredoxin domain-containing protein [Rhodoferax sp.]
MRRFLVLLVLSTALGFGVSFAAVQESAFPGIAAGDPKSETKIEFYLSPTCPMCAATFRNTVLPLLSLAASGTDLFVFVGIMPRSNEDVKFARVLSCVPQAQLLSFMADWYFYRRNGPASFKHLLSMGKNHGITGANEEQCANERNDRVLLGFNHLVFTDQGLKETPAIFLNGKNVPNTYYLWQLEERLPQLVRSKK